MLPYRSSARAVNLTAFILTCSIPFNCLLIYEEAELDDTAAWLDIMEMLSILEFELLLSCVRV